jgi:hypothetical protein
MTTYGSRDDNLCFKSQQQKEEFELAAYAQSQGAEDVEVEAATDESSLSRGDLTFRFDGARYDVELKTCNTNWRMPGVQEPNATDHEEPGWNN